MSTRSKLAALMLGATLAALAQPAGSQLGQVKIDFPPDAPVSMVSFDWGGSRSEARGGAMMLDLHTALQLKNSSQSRIRAVTLLVSTQDITPGGKASVAATSLDVHSGDTFPMRIDLRLLRPLLAGGGPLVRIDLDGVLFDNLSFYGPDKLNSRRAMTVWELEARRDRQYFKSVLQARGPEALRTEVIQSLARQAEAPSVQVSRAGRGRVTAQFASTGEAAVDRQFAFLRLPDAPVELVSGSAQVSGGEAALPRIEVRNRSERTVKYLELGWIVQDRQGREFNAGSLRAPDAGLRLRPGQNAELREDSVLRFSRPGQAVQIAGIKSYVSQVEFEDGSFWIPGRSALADPSLRGMVVPSAEEQRLTDLYRRKGLAALVSELKKF